MGGRRDVRSEAEKRRFVIFCLFCCFTDLSIPNTCPESDSAADADDTDRLADLAAKQAFEERLAARDSSKTRQLGADKVTLDAAAEAQRRRDIAASLASDDKRLLLSARERSRYDYLAKREEQKLGELEVSLAREEKLFRDEKLTERERVRLDAQRTVLRLAKERKGMSADVGGYQMPAAYEDERGMLDRKKAEQVLTARLGGDDASAFVSEQDEWEAQQIRTAQGREARGGKQRGDEYEYLIEEEVEFVLESTVGGTIKDEEEEGKGKEVHVSAAEKKGTLKMDRKWEEEDGYIWSMVCMIWYDMVSMIR